MLNPLNNPKNSKEIDNNSYVYVTPLGTDFLSPTLKDGSFYFSIIINRFIV